MPDGNGKLNDKLGIQLVEISAERVVGTMPVEGNTQPYGLLHGGASVALAETLGSMGSGRPRRAVRQGLRSVSTSTRPTIGQRRPAP